MKEEKLEIKFNLYKETLFEVVYKHFDIEEEILISKIQIREVADVRRIIVKLLRFYFPNSKLQTIGSVVNRGSSNTTLQLIEHNNLLNTNYYYTKKFQLIEFELRKQIQLKKSLLELEEDKHALERELVIINSIIQEKKVNNIISKIDSIKYSSVTFH